MKKIAITPRLVENESYHEIREVIDTRWGCLLIECGIVPFVFVTDFTLKLFDELSFDGVILTGGNDLNSVTPNKLSEKRDLFEKHLLKYCIDKKIPVFGVCRGCQFIASFFGAKLQKISDHVAVRHKLVKEYAGLSEVNSYHHWEIVELPYCFDVLATTSDGCIEAIKHKEYPISAVMWHPERENPFRQEDCKIICESFNIF
ncbi:MAG: gamma-glutamyl-gamma-aminobutyrate hydrolase family protein [Planctomycetaceae bacterium]|jgi:putative glutamine amidotransferase|nr:gamma-glutamyl-gamma-aminobutyrate hydrolase family protein [Planctomycetaceae bacterium]